MIDFGTYFISEWPFLAPEQPSLLLRPPTGLPCRLSPSTIQVGGVLLAREQRRLAAILTADVVGYSHAAYEQIYYSSLMPRTNLCARLLETLD